MDKPGVELEKELSGTLIIFIVSGGVFLLIFFTIFAKRQIMRFALRSRRGPHVPIGHDAGKAIKKEIERRLDSIQNISFDPKLLPDDPSYILQSDADLPPYYYRLKAVDDIKLLEKEIAKHDSIVRQPRESVRAFLLTSLLAAPMMSTGTGQRLIHQFCDMYDHARYDANEFGLEEYETYERLLMKLLDAAKALKTFSNNRKTSPNRTPIKKQNKSPSLLDPSKLNPPPTLLLNEDDTIGIDLSTNTRINYGVGIQSQNKNRSSDGSQDSNLDVNAIVLDSNQTDC